jgi:hypothetical protein
LPTEAPANPFALNALLLRCRIVRQRERERERRERDRDRDRNRDRDRERAGKKETQEETDTETDRVRSVYRVSFAENPSANITLVNSK